jgi:hypothetical protein
VNYVSVFNFLVPFFYKKLRVNSHVQRRPLRREQPPKQEKRRPLRRGALNKDNIFIRSTSTSTSIHHRSLWCTSTHTRSTEE